MLATPDHDNSFFQYNSNDLPLRKNNNDKGCQNLFSTLYIALALIIITIIGGFIYDLLFQLLMMDLVSEILSRNAKNEPWGFILITSRMAKNYNKIIVSREGGLNSQMIP